MQLASPIRALVLTTLLSLLFTALTPSAFAQDIPSLDPAIVYGNCLNRASSAGTSADSCRTEFLREFEYVACLSQGAQNCQAVYINSELSDHLISCLTSHPGETARCQTSYSPTSNFAICIENYKNPVDCDRVFGFKIENATLRNAEIQTNTLPGINPLRSSIGTLISNGLQIMFVAAALFALVFVVIGAFKWIISGGDKEAIAKARGTITSAFVGLAILALAFFTTVLFGQVVGIDITNLPQIPTLTQPPTPFSP